MGSFQHMQIAGTMKGSLTAEGKIQKIFILFFIYILNKCIYYFIYSL